ncbi:hypothetical protein HK102_002257 [Quaeritorhiza haematococci]|nr:hypothetical protein HK102_002257 [Quaeritorhiza haematococci]
MRITTGVGMSMLHYLTIALHAVLVFRAVLAQNITIKIASANYLIPSANESRVVSDNDRASGIDYNRQSISQQALLDYWNANHTYYPENVKFELIYGGYQGVDGNAVLEAIRLLQQNASVFISHNPSTVVIAEQNVINLFKILQCGSISSAGELSNKAVAKTFFRTIVVASDWGKAVGDYLAKTNLRRVAVLAEEVSVCQSVVNGFTKRAAENNITILVTRFLPPTLSRPTYMANYRYNYNWRQYIKSVRDSGVRVVLHCGYNSLFSLVDEAKGYIQGNQMHFVTTTVNLMNTDVLRAINYTHIIPYLYGSVAITFTRTTPVPNAYRSFMENDVLGPTQSNPPFKTSSAIRINNDDQIYAACLYTIIPTMSELVKQGLVTWQDIAGGKLLTKITYTKFLEVANSLNLTGLAGRPFAFDVATGDPTNELYFYNVYNKTVMNIAQTWNGTNMLIAENIGLWYNGTIQLDREFTYPDGSQTPPRVMPLTFTYERSRPLFTAMFALTIVLEVLYIATFAVMIVYRDRPAIRKNSFTFICVIILGCMLMQTSTIAEYFGDYESAVTCRLAGFLFHFGFAIAFTAVILKVWRIYRIFNNKKGTSLKLHDTTLLMYWGIFMVVFLVILFAQIFAGGVALKVSVEVIDDITSRTWSVCGADPIEYILLVLELLMLLAGTVFAIQTRKIRDDYSEANSLGISIYNSLFIIIVAFALKSVISSTPDITVVINFLRSALITFTVVAVMCIPKLFVGHAPESQSPEMGVKSKPSSGLRAPWSTGGTIIKSSKNNGSNPGAHGSSSSSSAGN